MKRQLRSLTVMTTFALAASLVHAQKPKSSATESSVVAPKAPAPELTMKDPVVGRHRRAVLQDRLKDKRAELKETSQKIEALKKETPPPADQKEQLESLEKRKKSLNSLVERTKGQLSKEKRNFKKGRADEEKRLKRLWGKHLKSSAAKAEVAKHSRRVAMLERIHYVALVNRQFEVAGRAAAALRAEEYRYVETNKLISDGVQIPPLPGSDAPTEGAPGGGSDAKKPAKKGGAPAKKEGAK